METTVSTVVKCENSLLAGMEKSRRYIPVREIASDRCGLEFLNNQW